MARTKPEINVPVSRRSIKTASLRTLATAAKKTVWRHGKISLAQRFRREHPLNSYWKPGSRLERGDRSVHGLAEPSDDLGNIIGSSDIGRRQQGLIAAVPIDRAACGINDQPVAAGIRAV